MNEKPTLKSRAAETTAQPHQNRERLDRLLDKLPVAAYACDPQGRITYFNEHAERLWGRAPALNSDDDRYCGSFRIWTLDGRSIAHADCAMAVALQTGQAQQAEVYLERADGRRVAVQACVNPIFDAAGNLLGASNVLVEVTEQKRTAEALRESQRQYHSLVENLPVCLFRKDLDGRFTFANRRFCDLLGQPLEQIVGRTDADYFPPELARAYRDDDREVIRTRSPMNKDEQHSNDKGNQFVQVIKVPIRDDRGEVVGVQGVFWDITERKLAEAKLRESEERLRLVVEQAPAIVWGVDASMRITLSEGKGLAGLGLKPGEVVGMPLPHYLQSDDPHHPMLVLHQRAIRGESIEFVTQWNGRHLQCRLEPMRDGGGQMVGCLGVSIDVTESEFAKQALRESEERLRTIIDSEPECVKIVSGKGELLSMNPAGLAMLDAESLEAVKSRSLSSFICPEYRKPFVELHRRVVNGERGTLEFEIVSMQGRRRWLDTHAVPLRSSATGEVSMLGITRDITERKRAEQALRNSEERYRSVVEGSLQGILIHQDGRICYANEALARMFDYDSAAEIIGRPLWETFVIPENREELQARTRAILGGERVPPHSGWRAVGKHGRAIWVTTSASRIDFQGRPAVVALYLDITERKRAEEALRESEAFLRMSQRVGKMGSWRWDLTTNRVHWSDTMHIIYGTDPAEFDGTLEGAIRTTHPDDLPAVQQTVRRIIETGEAHPIEYRVIKRDGQIAHMWGLGEVIRDSQGRAIQVVGTVVDISERKRAEEDRRKLEAQIQHAQKLESLGVLAGGIAHDFNNLLTSMLGYASLARMQLANESPACPMLEEIEKAAQRAADLTQQMLAYSGKGKFVIQKLRLDTLVQEMTKLLKTVVSKKAKVEIELDSAAIEGDATQIRQVVMNLITNASDALEGNVGAIRVRTGVREVDSAYLRTPFFPDELPGGRYAFVDVEDTGCGMSDEILARVFDPFFTTKFTGRGLGLAAVLGIVRSHRGTIKVVSAPGQGTVFQVLIPSAESDPAGKNSNFGFELPIPKCQGSVLVVEDESIVREFALRVLEGAGFEVVGAADGRAGLDAFTEHRSSIVAILLDLTMPRMDGFEFLRQLRTIDADTPVLVMSGYSELELSSRFHSSEARHFIQKPFHPRELVSRICEMLAKPGANS